MSGFIVPIVPIARETGSAGGRVGLLCSVISALITSHYRCYLDVCRTNEAVLREEIGVVLSR